jgi:hypothetical protein
MGILPLRTLPPPSIVSRRHTPRRTIGRHGYRAYRACLRWDFGFTCAFCLLHEADLAELGTEGLGLTSIEHFVPASEGGDQINKYENCFYVCRFCNGSRSDSPIVDDEGNRLLNPCIAVWADHFSPTEDDRLDPLDSNAAYTAKIYDLNESRKVKLRRWRREHLQEWIGILKDGPRLLTALLEQSANAASSEESGNLIETAAILRDSIRRASNELLRYAAIPSDADPACRCRRNDHHVLPLWLQEQTAESPI